MSEAREYKEVIPLMPEVAAILQRNTEQLGAYLVQMAQMMGSMQRRLDEIEQNQQYVTLSHKEVCGLRAAIRLRADEYCYKYGLVDPKDAQAIRGAVKRSILTRYGIKDLHDCPKIALDAIMKQIDRWADIRMVYKLRDRHREDGG